MPRAAQTAHRTIRTGPRSLDRKALSAPALRTFFRIAALWNSVAERSFSFLDRVKIFVKPMAQPLLRGSR